MPFFGTVRTKLSLILAGRIMYSLALLVLWHFQRHLHSVPDMLPLVFVISILSLWNSCCKYFQVLLFHFFYISALMYLIKETFLTMLSKLVTHRFLSTTSACFFFLAFIACYLYSLFVYTIHMYIIFMYICINLSIYS